MKQQPNFSLTGEDFEKMSSPCLYAWKRGGEYLYIGMSSKGLARPLTHNIIGCTEEVQKNDEILIWSLPELNDSQLEAMEGRLIDKHDPKYNVAKRTSLTGQGAPELHSEFPCQSCGKLFISKRRWQRFCSRKCRYTYHNAGVRKIAPKKTCPHCGKAI